MGAITLDGILRVEHELTCEGLMNSGNQDIDLRDTYNYIFGINDFANELIKKLEGKSGNDND